MARVGSRIPERNGRPRQTSIARRPCPGEIVESESPYGTVNEPDALQLLAVLLSTTALL